MKRAWPPQQIVHQSLSQRFEFPASNSMRNSAQHHADVQCGWASQQVGEAPTRLTLQQPLIVIIDDSPTVRTIVKTCLQRAAFRVKEFEDGVEALQWLGTPKGEFPAIVYLDIGLPRMDGYEVLRMLRTKPEYSKTVTIMLSSRDGLIDRLKGRLAGASDYVTKPFRTEDLLATTRAALERSEVLHPLPVAQLTPATGTHS